MAETKKVIIDVELKTQGANGGLDNVNKGVDETKKRVKNLKTETDKTSKAMTNGFKAGADAAAIIPGPIGQAAVAMNGLTASVGKFVTSLNTVKGALIATGIGAFLVVIGSLIAYFTQTERGAQKLRVAMAAMGAVVGSVSDAFIGLVDAAQMFIKGDFKGGIDKVKTSFSDLGGEIQRDVKAAIELEGVMNKIKVAERELVSERAKANKEIANARLIADDLTKSTKERGEAIEKAGEIEGRVAAKEQDIAKLRLQTLEAQADLNETNEDALAEIEAARARVSDLEKETIMRQKRLGMEVQALKTEEAAKDKERDAQRLAEIKERNNKEVELAKQKALELEAALKAQYENELRLAQEAAEGKLLTDDYIAERQAVTAEERLALEIERALAAEDMKFNAVMEALFAQDATKAEYQLAQDLYEQEQMIIKNDLTAAFNEKKLTDEEKLQADILKAKQDGDAKVLAAEKKMKDARLAIGSSLASGLGSLGQIITTAQGEQTAASKVFALGQLAVNTAMSISSAIAGATEAATATGPGAVIATPLFIATQIATVLAAVAQASTILASVPGGGSPSMPTSAASIGASAPQIAPVTTNTTQLGNTQQAELAPVQAYVVETQITGSQTNINQIESQSTFGDG